MNASETWGHSTVCIARPCHCEWCQDELSVADKLVRLDEMIFHAMCAELYRLHCRQLKQVLYN
jgi:hypothetical protein